MSKKLKWGSNFTVDDINLDWEDDIYQSFPFLKLRKNGLTIKNLDDLVVITDNMVRGLTK